MRRDSKEYQDRKAAWELVQTRAWVDFLKPILEVKTNASEHKEICNIEDTYTVAKEHAVIEYARHLKRRIERYAQEFPYVKVDLDA